jgi:hypothetical protein
MIKIEKFKDFDDSIDEGKLLLAAMSVLTSITCNEIKNGEFGGMTSPDEAFVRIIDIANKIYYEKEYKEYKLSLKISSKRDKIINDIIK